jgi:hypothetical protein
MRLSGLKQSLLYIVGVILLGLLTNAIWEFLGKPLLISAQNTILNLSTLGIQQFKDSMYQEIAMGHYDRAGTFLVTHFVGFTSAAMVVATGLGVAFSRKLKRRRIALMLKLQEPDQEQSAETIIY